MARVRCQLAAICGARSWAASPGWGCWWSTGSPIWTRAVGLAWAPTRTPSSASR